jgi:hypothetical protein
MSTTVIDIYMHMIVHTTLFAQEYEPSGPSSAFVARLVGADAVLEFLQGIRVGPNCILRHLEGTLFLARCAIDCKSREVTESLSGVGGQVDLRREGSIALVTTLLDSNLS